MSMVTSFLNEDWDVFPLEPYCSPACYMHAVRISSQKMKRASFNDDAEFREDHLVFIWLSIKNMWQDMPKPQNWYDLRHSKNIKKIHFFLNLLFLFTTLQFANIYRGYREFAGFFGYIVNGFTFYRKTCTFYKKTCTFYRKILCNYSPCSLILDIIGILC